MAQGNFVERDCAIGGCSCGHWSDWWQALRDYAKAHERGKALDAIEDGDRYSEAVDDLAAELADGFRFEAPACARADCARAA